MAVLVGILRSVTEERIATVRGIFDAWSKGDFRATDGLLADDVKVTWAEPPTVVVSMGPDESAERLRLLLDQWEDFRAEAEELIPVGESSILAVAKQYGTGSGSGLPVDARVYIVISFRDEEITGVHWHFEREDALKAADLE